MEYDGFWLTLVYGLLIIAGFYVVQGLKKAVSLFT
jgi:hypothetical protein